MMKFLFAPLVPTLNYIQVISYILTIITLVFGTLCLYKYKRFYWIILSFLTFPIHTFIFYSALIFVYITKLSYDMPVFTGWSAGLRLHGIIIIAIIVVYVARRGKKWM
jgi:hypothetical protein